MAGSVGNITTDIIKSGLVFNMDAANRASYPKTGTTATDTIGNIVGTLSGANGDNNTPQWENTNNGAFNFDGTDDIITTVYNLNYDLTGAQTFNFWFNQPSSQSGGSYPVTFGSGSQIKFYIQFYDPLGRIRVKLFDGGGGDIDVTNLGVSYVSNGWHHIAFTTDATTTADKVIMYFDGVPLSVKDTLSNSGVRAAGTSGFYFGKIPNAGFFKGLMSNFQYYNRELSANEVLHNYNALKGRFGL